MVQQVFKLVHFKISRDDPFSIEGDAPDMKAIGVYATEAIAHAAIEGLREKRGFRDWPDGFRVLPITLDEDRWPDGFDPD